MSEKKALNVQPFLVFLSLIVLGASIFMVGLQSGRQPKADATPPTVQPKQVDVDADDDPVLGEDSAPITMIEFSDFQCPYCRSFFTDTLPLIKENFIDKGLVKLVYRDLPLTALGHTDSLPAANAANCAREQGGDEAYFAYHDKIFEGQNKLGRGTVVIPAESLTTYAEELDLDMGKFNSCQETLKYKDEVLNDASTAQVNGMNGTPTFVINGQMVVGSQPYELFETYFNQLLNQ